MIDERDWDAHRVKRLHRRLASQGRKRGEGSPQDGAVPSGDNGQWLDLPLQIPT